MGSRVERLNELAAEAFPSERVTVETMGDEHVQVWTEDGDMLLMVQHPLADEVLGVLARRPGVMSIAAALDCAEIILRRRSNRHGLDIAGLRDGRIMFWTDEGCVATGASLRDAIANLDKRRSDEDSIEPLPELGEGVETMSRISPPLPPGVRPIESSGPHAELRSDPEDRQGEGDTIESLELEAQRLRFEGKRLADVGERLVQKLEVDSVMRARRAARYVAKRMQATLDQPVVTLEAVRASVALILQQLDDGDASLQAAFEDILDGPAPEVP